MTVIAEVECESCGETHQVICNHDGKECEYCGRPFKSEEERKEHEPNCSFNDENN